MSNIDATLEKILPQVLKPTRYVGTEYGSVHKDWNHVSMKMVFAFPDVYEVAMSHLGTRILYAVVNEREDALMERVCAPWVDMEAKMREHNVPLFSLESRRDVKEFDVLGFTLQYEMSFTNIVNMLDLARIPFYTRERLEDYPLIIAGGPCAFNPEPLAELIDCFVIGEGEEVINELLDVVKAWKGTGRSKLELLKDLAQVEGLYIPLFYDVTYNQEGKFLTIKPNQPEARARITKRIIKDFDKVAFPLSPIVPFQEIVHDRIMLEVLRGCTRGCRFCQAGMIYRPVREKSLDTLLEQAEALVKSTGYNEIALTSLSSSDYTCIGQTIDELLKRYKEKRIGLSLPSLRLDSFSVDLAQKVQEVRKTGLTFAPEAGTQRLRDVINKGVTEENLTEAVTGAFANGWSTVKLYFMIGLPTETYEDLDGIAEMAHKVVAIGKEKGVRRLKVTVSASSYVPKAHTPFQWVAQDDLVTLEEKQVYLRNKLKHKAINFNYHDARLSRIEAVFARGDRQVGNALVKAWELGCKFDGWSEHFKYETWLEAMAATGIEVDAYAQRQFAVEDPLPWDHIDAGVSKAFLELEYTRAVDELVTGDCRFTNCQACNLCPALDTDLDLKGEVK